MTTKQKIEQLEKEVAELKMKVQLLEARPMVITITPQIPAYVPSWSPSYPSYTGDPIRNVPMCQSHNNMSASSSNLVQ